MRICSEGWPFILGGVGVGIVLFILARLISSSSLGVLAGLAFLTAAFCAYFFRDPDRQIPAGDRWILSPADGKIMEIVEGRDPIDSGPVWILRIFLSVFEPHLQRAPIAGRIGSIRYTKGKFLDARDPKAAFENEQNRLEIVASPLPRQDFRRVAGRLATSPDGRGRQSTGEATIVVTQIAGLIARRIVCWVKEGQQVLAGERLGLIRFGSQVDLVMPGAAQIRVKAGDHVTAGDTIIAEL